MPQGTSGPSPEHVCHPGNYHRALAPNMTEWCVPASCERLVPREPARDVIADSEDGKDCGRWSQFRADVLGVDG